MGSKKHDQEEQPVERESHQRQFRMYAYQDGDTKEIVYGHIVQGNAVDVRLKNLDDRVEVGQMITAEPPWSAPNIGKSIMLPSMYKCMSLPSRIVTVDVY